MDTAEIMGRTFKGISSNYVNDWGYTEYTKEYFYECPNGMITVNLKMSRQNLSDADLLFKILKKI